MPPGAKCYEIFKTNGGIEEQLLCVYPYTTIFVFPWLRYIYFWLGLLLPMMALLQALLSRHHLQNQHRLAAHLRNTHIPIQSSERLSVRFLAHCLSELYVHFFSHCCQTRPPIWDGYLACVEKLSWSFCCVVIRPWSGSVVNDARWNPKGRGSKDQQGGYTMRSN